MPESDEVAPESLDLRAAKQGLPLVNPDAAEQELGDIDNVPSFSYQQTPMVGLGGSAGSIQALQQFFETVPPDSGMAFVVILHLAPDYVSMLAEMIGTWTRMKAMQAEDGIHVEPNTVYVIPPGKHLTSTNGHLKLTELDREHGRRVAVDLFFRSLADTHGPHGIAVVLSGADGDGTLGIKRMKERGGLTIAQDPEEAEHDSMPRAAIGTGMIDWVLPAREMPARILSYRATEKNLALPPEEGPQPAMPARPTGDAAEAALREVLVFLRMRTGRDFTCYKRATILRRISRRMQVNAVDDLPGYLSFLRLHPGEAGALLKDLLISVTNFFRDRDAFTALQAYIPGLFEGKSQSDTVRIWVPGCATGEEAYSIAIMLIEHARTLDMPPALQVFGCDLDDDAVQVARAGIFPDAITADVSEERLRRFFVKEHRGYRIRREVREIVLFAAHDLLKDAPFSRLDMVSCRNLLIYLNRDAQARAFDIFHFALKNDGKLFLGSSDSVEDGSSFFTALNKKFRIYARRAAARIGMPLPSGPSTMLLQQHQASEQLARSRSPVVIPPPSFTQSSSLALTAARAAVAREDDRVSLNELHYRLIECFAPLSVLINADHDIQHLSESAGRFLVVAGGEPTTNLLRLVNPSLRIELRSALFRAAQTGEVAEATLVPMEIEGQTQPVNIRVSPAKDLARDFLLVEFDARSMSVATAAGPAAVPAQAEPIVQHMEREMEHIKGHLRDTVEQYEASTEELKAMNEELRSATEELETSREELQSINEELTTVNQELKSKVDELGHANSDLQHHIDYHEMAADAARVLDTLLPLEREVSGLGNRGYLARMLPYRTVDDRIAGVVLTFVDITERQQTQKAIQEQMHELTRFNNVAVGRESRMIELKKEINELCTRQGQPLRYSENPEPGP